MKRTNRLVFIQDTMVKVEKKIFIKVQRRQMTEIKKKNILYTIINDFICNKCKSLYFLSYIENQNKWNKDNIRRIY